MLWLPTILGFAAAAQRSNVAHACIKRNPKNMQKAKNFNKQQISEEVDESSAPTSLIFVVCRLLFRY